MNINFSNTDLVFMYGHFRKQARKLTEMKNAPNCPIDSFSLDQDIDLFTKLADKLKEAYPNLSQLDNYKI